jgi:2-oxo-4-hydroxy-4-carboxy-5-ureidoimidazoline decarboxylase
VAGADDQVRAELAAGNQAYEDRFGHIYLVCATGRSARELLGILRGRLGHDPDQERAVVRAELIKINDLRLATLTGESAEATP